MFRHVKILVQKLVSRVWHRSRVFTLQLDDTGSISSNSYDLSKITRSNFWAQKPGITPEHWGWRCAGTPTSTLIYSQTWISPVSHFLTGAPGGPVETTWMGEGVGCDDYNSFGGAWLEPGTGGSIQKQGTIS